MTTSETNKSTFLVTLKALGFKVGKDANSFVSNTAYKITVKVAAKDVASSTIDFGPEITVHHKSACNFLRPENLVTLECVLRLLRKGYPACSIELEKTWKLGHREKGRLDILIRHKKAVFAMIECKTWGEEYLKERDNALEDGGQLFSYFVQERTAKVLVLYCSKVDSSDVTFQAESINTTAIAGTNIEEMYSSWDKSFVQDGLFHELATVYDSKKRNLQKNDLRELDRDSGRGLFNSFAEILRRHVISDKSNAFNKIFNLFVCKIYDEDTKRLAEDLDFQWKISDTLGTLMERLGSLYMRGLKDYLAIEITKDHFSPYTEFAFSDVFNKDSFEKNFTVVKEVVELLQGYQIKYTSKHQFLGDFFEKLLNTGIKQEAGQFFTPIPLARFFLRSLPIEAIIQHNIREKTQHVLPFVLDYACGSGHFLTEAIEEVEEHIARIDSRQLVGRIQKHFLAIKENFYWAKDYVYGIEKDYRLAKTTKIALFLNGDGDARIINGDALDDFFRSRTFMGVLKTDAPQKLNEQFDIIVSNPPFSIAGFKRYLRNGAENFSLFPRLSAKSAEIECLFVERLAHLLREEGCAGIILPLSVLNSVVGVYVATRIKLLIHFDLVGLVELRDKTFSETNTTTVGVFLQKRSRKHLGNVLTFVRSHYVNKRKCAAVVEAVQLIGDKCSDRTFDEAEIVAFFEKSGVSKSKVASFQVETESMPESLVVLLIYMLNRKRETVTAYAGEKKEQEEFLGYRFSKSRGREGIEVLTENGVLNSALYDPKKPSNPEKLNTHIKSNFFGKPLPVPEVLKKSVRYIATLDLLEDYSYKIKNPSGFFESTHLIICSNSRLGDVIDDCEQETYQFPKLIESKQLTPVDGLTYNKGDEVPRKTLNRVLTASNLILETGRLDLKTKLIHLREDYKIPEVVKPRRGDIVVCKASGSLKHLGKCAYVTEDVDAAVGGFLFILRPASEALGKAIFYRLLSLKFRQFVGSLRDQNINNMGISDLARFSLTLPADLEKFSAMIKKLEAKRAKLEGKLSDLENK